MRMIFRYAAVAVLLAACGTPQQFSAPRNADNACALVRERPGYLNATRASERRWGVSVPIQLAIIHAESSFIGNARTPVRWTLGVIPMGRQSSALGYSQALDGTWEEYLRETGNRRANRKDISDAADFIGWYSNWSHRRNGIALDDAFNLYLAYHEGHAGFRRQTYQGRPWILNVARRVEERAIMYDQQLRTCGLRAPHEPQPGPRRPRATAA